MAQFVVCFSVPFDEDDKDDSVWYLDHDYLENMYNMFKKVNGKNNLVIAAFLKNSYINRFYSVCRRAMNHDKWLVSVIKTAYM